MSVFKSFNPADETVIGQYTCSTKSQIDTCYFRAVKAYSVWKARPMEERKKWLKRFKRVLSKSVDQGAVLVATETGKPLSESRAEVAGALKKIELVLESLSTRVPDFSGQSETLKLFRSYKPVGVMSVIGPFNFPVHLPLGVMLPALLAGNVLVFKASEFTTGVGQWLLEKFQESGLPDGVLQGVIGTGKQGEQMCGHALSNAVLFTGGYQTGQKISAQLGKTPEKLLVLELGGNNPLVVSSYRSVAKVVHIIRQSAYLTAGQRCTCARRLIVVENEQTDRLIQALVQSITALSVGAFDADPEPFMGPLISASAKQRLLDHYEYLCKQGGRVLVPMTSVGERGFFVSPGLVDVSTCYESVPDEEFFGPLLTLIRVSSLQEAISVANQTEFGLSASLISRSKREFQQFYDQVDAGVINWNRPTNGSSSLLPFGGVGKSGNFRPAGAHAMDFCVVPIASVWGELL